MTTMSIPSFVLINLLLIWKPLFVSSQPNPAPAAVSPTLVFGVPEIFITTESQKFDPYRHINKYRRTSLMQEYVIYAKGNTVFRSNLVMFDLQATDVVEQNLGKERYWAFLNNTGAQPWYTLINSTYQKNSSYQAEADGITFTANYQRNFISRETIPPYDLVFEIPRGTRNFRTTKVMIDYHSWGVLRWQLSDTPFVTWQQIKDSVDALRPSFPNGTVDPQWQVVPGNFIRLPNPCLHDLFMLYMIVGEKGTPNHQIYADIPAFHFVEDVPNFYNLTGSFCPSQKKASHEECGHPRQIVLTNDHLVALTDKGIYVSASIKMSDKDVSVPYDEKPLLSYELVDPCEQFDKYVSCFRQGHTSLSVQLVHSIRLFYAGVCILYQYPFAEDRLIVVIEHTTAPPDANSTTTISKDSPVKAVTILYASDPYKVWKALFIGKNTYNGSNIVGLVGIFFNHQLRHFDITLKIMGDDKKSIEYVRFVLLDPVDPPKPTAERSIGYNELNGLQGKGFLEKRFPKDTEVMEVVVSPVTMDVFFLGNQLWIAESGLSLVYVSIGKLLEQSNIGKCSFNHPDRSYVCVDHDNDHILVGRVGTHYAPAIIDVKTILEVWEAAGIEGSYWSEEYSENVLQNGIYMAAYSGKIHLWYLFDEKDLADAQDKLIGANPDPTACKALFSSRPAAEQKTYRHKFHHLEKSCNQLVANKADEIWNAPGTGQGNRGAFFRMIAIDTHKIKAEQTPTDGPLVPLMVDASTVVLFEAVLPGIDADYVYFSPISVGQQIVCNHDEADESKNCDIFVRHIKPIGNKQVLMGFRQVIYGTLKNPFVLGIVKSRVMVLQVPATNLVFIMMEKLTYSEAHVGWSHMFPGRFSVLLRGFPDKTKKNVMWGYATFFETKLTLFTVGEYESWVVDLSTKTFRDKRTKTDPPGVKTIDEMEWEQYQAKNEENKAKQDKIFAKDLEIKKKIQTDYVASKFRNITPIQLFTITEGSSGIELFEPLKIMENATKTITPPWTAGSDVLAGSDNTSWIIEDGGCHLKMELLPNPVLKSHGGRIHLDLHDSLSFSVKVQATTEIGRLTLYRPLFVITNSNPGVVKVERKITTSRTDFSQRVDIVLTPTGAGLGISNFMVRPVISSFECQSTSSITFIVQVHRKSGRRLFVNYPFPLCTLPTNYTGWKRQYHKDSPICVSAEEILEAGRRDDAEGIRREGTVLFTKLPPNYRPPSTRGEKIPLNQYTYNADPSKEKYHNSYYISKDTQKFRKCNFRKSRAECGCSDGDKLSDHPDLSDCKEMVFTITRAKSSLFSFEYDPLMIDEHQHVEFFDAKDHLSVFVEEINNRTEYTLYSELTAVVDAINKDNRLNEGKKFYDADNITVTLHGTGLFHFRACLGKFDTFEEVCGHFILYSDSNELNHVRLAVVMLLTMTFCFSLVFFGFIRVRRRLSSQLPFQTKAKMKLKDE